MPKTKIMFVPVTMNTKSQTKTKINRYYKVLRLLIEKNSFESLRKKLQANTLFGNDSI